MLPADILVIAGPIWLGDNSSITKKVIERLYGNSHLLNEAGQYAYYGRVGGCLITGNEDGVKHCAQNAQLSLREQHRLPGPAPTNAFRYDAGTWRLDFAGQEAHLPDATGLHDIATLLRHPGREVHVFTLLGMPAPPAGADGILDEEAEGPGPVRHPGGDSYGQRQAGHRPVRQGRKVLFDGSTGRMASCTGSPNPPHRPPPATSSGSIRRCAGSCSAPPGLRDPVSAQWVPVR